MKRHFQSGDERQEVFFVVDDVVFLRDFQTSAAWEKLLAVHFPNSNHNSFSHEMFKMKRQYLLTWSALGMYAPSYPLPICLWRQGEDVFFLHRAGVRPHGPKTKNMTINRDPYGITPAAQ